jgi:gas vesicle protein
MSDSNGNSFLWFLAGLGIGALAGVLYAPRSGRETREALMERAEEGREYLANRTRQARETVTQAVERGRTTLGRVKEQGTAAIEAARQAYRESAETGSPGKST